VYDPTQQISDSYYSSLVANLHYRSNEANAAAASAVYTPLHGVGGKYVLRAFKVGRCARCACMQCAVFQNTA
jgi:phosphomannomutase